MELKMANNNINPMNSNVYDVSDMDNEANYNQNNTLAAIDAINKLYGDAGYDDVAQFMKNMTATESNAGEDSLGNFSFGATQIDPTRYIDIVDRSHTGDAKKRMDLANTFLREKLGDENFDLRTALDVASTRNESGYVTSAKYNPNETLSGHNPYISAALTRLGLANIPDGDVKISDMNLRQQGDYWKKHWNTESGAHDADFFMKQSQHHFPKLQEGAFLDEVVNPASDRAFQ